MDGFVRVNYKNTCCTCNQYQVTGQCRHLAQAYRWINHFDRYLSLSALHKEIRRGDLARARSWSEIMLRHQGENSLLKYLERIIFEESRNYSLFVRLQEKSISFTDALTILTLSPKKWDLKFLNQPRSHFENWHEGYRLSNARPPLSPIELNAAIRDNVSVAEIYSFYFDIIKDKSLRPFLVGCLRELAADRKNEAFKIYMTQDIGSSYEIMVGLELMMNLYGEEATKLRPEDYKTTAFIPAERIYHHDQHTARGKAFLRQNFWYAYNKRCFQIENIDLRYSGSLFGCLFREECVRQKGGLKDSSGKDWQWKDVVIDARKYEMALELEQFYYKSKYLFPNSPQNSE